MKCKINMLMIKCNVNQKLLQTQILLYFTTITPNVIKILMLELTISSVPIIYTFKIINQFIFKFIFKFRFRFKFRFKFKFKFRYKFKFKLTVINCIVSVNSMKHCERVLLSMEKRKIKGYMINHIILKEIQT